MFTKSVIGAVTIWVAGRGFGTDTNRRSGPKDLCRKGCVTASHIKGLDAFSKSMNVV